MSPSLNVRLGGRLAAVVAVSALLTSSARAEYVIDLTKANTPAATYNGAIYSQTALQPVGTGVFDPFVRIEMTGTERGYNTDARTGGSSGTGVEFDTKDENQWTRSLPLNSLGTVTINGTAYYQFTLDINEEGNTSGRLLSLNEVQVYLGNSGSLTGFTDEAGFAGGTSVKVYTLDSTGDARVDLNAKDDKSPGSGVADLNVYIPVSAFAAYANSPYQYVYLYSAFGCPYPSDAGFEEWSALKGTPPTGAVPAPPAVLLGLLGFGGCLLGRGFRRKTAAAVEA
jgi:hypothetical protein